MTANCVLNIKVSEFYNFFKDPKTTTIGDVLLNIKEDNYKIQIEELRELANSDYKKYQDKKTKLSCVTFSATFNKERNRANLDQYNNIVILDIDKIQLEDIEKTKAYLNNDPYIFSYWLSPSGFGIKALVVLNYLFNTSDYGINQSHKIAFEQILDYYQSKYQISLDKSGSDFTRLCFYSWDPELVIKSDFKTFQVNNIQKKECKKQNETKKLEDEHIHCFKKIDNNLLENPLGKNNAEHRKKIKKIIRFLEMHKFSITRRYEEWLRVGFAISESFTFEVGLRYFRQLSKMDEDLFNEDECKRMLLNCFQYSLGQVHFSSIEYLAQQKGYINYKLEEQSTYAASSYTE